MSQLRKVLIVDDEGDVLRIGRIALELIGGLEVHSAAAADEAVELAAREHPDVVLLDLMMPRVDGCGVMDRLAARPETASIPVVLMSAGGLERRAQRAERIIGFIRKPFDPTTLANELRRLLADAPRLEEHDAAPGRRSTGP